MCGRTDWRRYHVDALGVGSTTEGNCQGRCVDETCEPCNDIRCSSFTSSLLFPHTNPAVPVVLTAAVNCMILLRFSRTESS